jgi:hypothetical protein
LLDDFFWSWHGYQELPVSIQPGSDEYCKLIHIDVSTSVTIEATEQSWAVSLLAEEHKVRIHFGCTSGHVPVMAVAELFVKEGKLIERELHISLSILIIKCFTELRYSFESAINF